MHIPNKISIYLSISLAQGEVPVQDGSRLKHIKAKHSHTLTLHTGNSDFLLNFISRRAEGPGWEILQLPPPPHPPTVRHV